MYHDESSAIYMHAVHC